MISALFVLIVGISLFIVGDSSATTDNVNLPQQISDLNSTYFNQQEPTPTPFAAAENAEFDLPVAHNPGLVLGAVILVLIIIGGVIINSNLFKKK
jgi:hypothetical protein